MTQVAAKAVFIFIAIGFFTNCALGQQVKPLDALTVRGVRIGSTYSTVIKRLGRPERQEIERQLKEESCLADEMTAYTLEYPNLRVFLLRYGPAQNPVVIGLSISGEKWSAYGIPAGASIESVKAKLGQPESIGKGDRENEVQLFYETKRFNGVSFVFENGGLIGVEQEELIC